MHLSLSPLETSFVLFFSLLQVQKLMGSTPLDLAKFNMGKSGEMSRNAPCPCGSKKRYKRYFGTLFLSLLGYKILISRLLYRVCQISHLNQNYIIYVYFLLLFWTLPSCFQANYISSEDEFSKTFWVFTFAL